MTTPQDRIGSRVVVASISGGKDSAAMSLHLRELGIEHQRDEARATLSAARDVCRDFFGDFDAAEIGEQSRLVQRAWAIGRSLADAGKVAT